MRDFLWNQGSPSRGKAKVAWKDICLPKTEGGLGIRKIADMNKALMTSHVWSILTKRDSVWVHWIYDYKLKNISFWDVQPRAGMTWSWRKLLQLRPSIRQHIRSHVGNGLSTSGWFDYWCELSQIIQHVTPRAISNAGFSLKDSVADLYLNGEWKFPIVWYARFPALSSLPMIHLHDREDSLEWYNNNGHIVEFSTTEVWDTIRKRGDECPWVNLVWFPQCIPRHAFHLWLVMRNKLKTQDKMKPWDAGSETNLRLMCCSLCQKGPDSHSHLFFECDYSSQIWNSLKPLAELQHTSNKWASIASDLAGVSQFHSVQMVISKLLVAATSYFIWQERNQRLFTDKRRKCGELIEIIKHIVRLKLWSMEFKNSTIVRRMLANWKLPARLVFDDG